MKKVLIIVVSVVVFIGVGYAYLYCRWQHLWILESEKESYDVTHKNDDTLRVAMIGDSWAGMHDEMLMDTVLQSRLTFLTGLPVIMKSRGKGGEKSRGIYQLMFEQDGYGTRLLIDGSDYCIVLAGINDAAANLGTGQFLHHMQLILDFLLSHQICPVIIEIPDVNICHLYGDKPVKDLLTDYMKSRMTGCGLYRFSDYREALKDLLQANYCNKHLLYIQMQGWNGDGQEINKNLFLEDQIHLNRDGYEQLDSCIALAIASDLK